MSMKYFVVYDDGEGLKVFPSEDSDSALQFAAHQKVNGASFVQVAEAMPGELVLTARLVSADEAKRPERKAAKLSRAKGAKRTPAEIDKLRTRVLSWVQTNPGKTTEDLGKALSLDTKELVLPVRKLLADKVIKKRGKARATKYFPMAQDRKPVEKRAKSSPKP